MAQTPLATCEWSQTQKLHGGWGGQADPPLTSSPVPQVQTSEISLPPPRCLKPSVPLYKDVTDGPGEEAPGSRPPRPG